MSDAPTSPEQPSSFIQELKLPSFFLSFSRLWFQSAALRHEYVKMYKCGKRAWITAKSFPWINKNFKILTPHLLRSAGCESLCRTPGSCQSARAAERRTVMKTLVKAVTLWCECLLWFYWEKYIYKTLFSPQVLGFSLVTSCFMLKESVKLPVFVLFPPVY